MSQRNRDKQKQKRKEAARAARSRPAQTDRRGGYGLAKAVGEAAAKVVDLIEGQKQLFREKFGREATAQDPLWFDPTQDAPVAAGDRNISENAVRIAEALGLKPEYAHAMRKTGTLISADNRDRFSLVEIRNWERAVSEYRALHPKSRAADDDDWLRILKE